LEWKIGLATPNEIDVLNIRQATFLAMRRAINALRIRPDYALVDGEGLQYGICSSSGIIRGDQRSFTIAAASIIAKETRDRLMTNLSQIHPAYRFEKNKGYGTKEHIEAILTEGVSPYHRSTFLRKLYGKTSDHSKNEVYIL
jgi:ribonuclease HII